MQLYNVNQLNEVLTVATTLDVQTCKMSSLRKASRISTENNGNIVDSKYFDNATNKETRAFFKGLGGREVFSTLKDGSLKTVSFSPNFNGRVQCQTRIYTKTELI